MSNARDWHAVALDKLDRQIAATADRWGECVHGPEVTIELRNAQALTIIGRGERSALAIVYRLKRHLPVGVLSLYVHPDPSARHDVLTSRGEQINASWEAVTVPDIQAAVDLVAETAGITPQLALTEGPT